MRSAHARVIAADQSGGHAGKGPVHSLIGPDWFYTAPAIVIAMIFGMVLTQGFPTILAILAFLMAVAMIAFSRRALPLEFIHANAVWKRLVVLALAVGMPMVLVGLGIWLWACGQPGDALALIALVSIVTAIIAVATLHGRLPSMVAALSGLATGLVALPAPLAALIIFAFSLVAGYVLATHHAERTNRAESERIDRERVQQRAESLLSEYEQTGQGWFWETDRRGAITYVSPRISTLLGAKADTMIGKPFISMFQLDEGDKESERTLKFHLSTRSSFQDLAVRAVTRETEERWWSITGRPVMDQYNNFLGFRGSGSDLTETKRSQRHVTQLARFDSLTKLANRFQMAEWLEKILDAPQEDRRACAIFLLDLDRFKQVNDTMGHPAGDSLLRQVADRLRSTVNGSGNVGRLGGDEFQVILPGRHKAEELGNLAHRIIENLSQPYSIDGARVTIGASLGISVCPDNGTTSEALIRNADLALYAAKDGGRGRFHFYADDLHSAAEERRQLEQDLRDALTNGELTLYYQPQVSTKSETITGFEALLRWNHPVHGDLSPAKFVPIAEDSGFVTQIGEWAIRAACDQLALWPEPVRIAVNVSPLQFANPSLPAIITGALAAAQIDPARLELEITESVFLNEGSSTDAMFSALKEIGVRLALDDFGTGYSSLGYLKKAPFDKIKIDQSFVRGATIPGSRNGAIISSIVTLAESLGMETTAEGVETLDELELIRALGCSHIQGFIYQRPLSAHAATERLRAGLAVVAEGPRSARAPRQTMLRKVVLEHGEYRYEGMVRNISPNGAMIEGLWNVPEGTMFDLHFAESYTVQATARWSVEDRMGIEFTQALASDGAGGVSLAPPPRKAEPSELRLLRKAG